MTPPGDVSINNWEAARNQRLAALRGFVSNVMAGGIINRLTNTNVGTLRELIGQGRPLLGEADHLITTLQMQQAAPRAPAPAPQRPAPALQMRVPPAAPPARALAPAPRQFSQNERRIQYLVEGIHCRVGNLVRQADPQNNDITPLVRSFIGNVIEALTDNINEFIGVGGLEDIDVSRNMSNFFDDIRRAIYLLRNNRLPGTENLDPGVLNNLEAAIGRFSEEMRQQAERELRQRRAEQALQQQQAERELRQRQNAEFTMTEEEARLRQEREARELADKVRYFISQRNLVVKITTLIDKFSGLPNEQLSLFIQKREQIDPYVKMLMRNAQIPSALQMEPNSEIRSFICDLYAIGYLYYLALRMPVNPGSVAPGAVVMNLFDQSVAEMRDWCQGHVVSPEDERYLRSVIGTLDEGLGNSLPVLRGNNTLVPVKRGCGPCEDISIIDWIPVARELLREGMRVFLDAANDDEVSSFQSLLQPWDQQFLEFLALKPFLLRSTLDFAATKGLNSEAKLIERLMPDLYNALDFAPSLQQILVKASFGEVINIPIFFALANRLLVNIPAMDSLHRDLKHMAWILADIEAARRKDAVSMLTEMLNDEDITLEELPFIIQLLIKDSAKIQSRSIAYNTAAAGGQEIIDLTIAVERERCALVECDENLAHACSFMMGYGNNVNYGVAASDRLWGQIRAIYRADPTLEQLENFINRDQEFIRDYVIEEFALDPSNPEDSPQIMPGIESQCEDLRRRVNRIRELRRNREEIEIRLNEAQATLGRRSSLISSEDQINIMNTISKKESLAEILIRIDKYNQFVNALRAHVHGTIFSYPDRGEPCEEQSDFSLLDVISEEKYGGINDFFPAPEIHEEWRGICGGLSAYNERLHFRLGGISAGGYPYLAMSATEFNAIIELPGLKAALAEYTYNLGVINLMSPTLNLDGNTVLLFDIAFDYWRQKLNVTHYIPREEISTIRQYKVNPVSDHFSLASLEGIIPADVRGLMEPEAKLRNMLKFCIIRAMYVIVKPGDAGYINFPHGEFDAKDRVVKLLTDAKSKQESECQYLSIANSANGDTVDKEWGEAIGIIIRNLSSSLYAIEQDQMSQRGIFVNPTMSKFATWRLHAFLESLRQVANPDDLTNLAGLVGSLINRFAHCTNGRTEGAMVFFSNTFLNFLRCSPQANSLINFPNMAQIVAFALANEIITNTLDFKLWPNGQKIEECGEEATAYGYALSLLGQRNMFGIPSHEQEHRYTMVNNLKVGNALRIVGLLMPQAKKDDRHKNALALCQESSLTTGNLSETIIGHLRGGLYEQAHNLIDRGDFREDNKELLHTYFTIDQLLRNGGDYGNMICNICQCAVNPKRMIALLLNDGYRSLLELLFEAYKQTREDLRGLGLANISPEEKRQLAFDMFVASGLFHIPRR
ncbi:MAG: hypothetical protein LBQ08_02285 [Holosporaceae bacterium]|nr:hypothetical protein [Holosporaceae bacterium]